MLRRPSLLLVLPLVLLAACGGGEDATPVDRGFAADMVPHHEGAVDMARLAADRAKTPFVRDLAEDILRTQPAEMERLREIEGRLSSAGVDRGKLPGVHHMTMGASEDLTKAEDFDRAFVESMIPHHESAVQMARAELAEGKDSETRKLAEQIIEAQQREIDAMREFLAER